MRTVGTVTEFIEQNSKVTTGDSTRLGEVIFVAQFAQARRVAAFWKDKLDVPPEQAVNKHVEDNPIVMLSLKKNRSQKTIQIVCQVSVDRLTVMCVTWFAKPSRILRTESVDL